MRRFEVSGRSSRCDSLVAGPGLPRHHHRAFVGPVFDVVHGVRGRRLDEIEAGNPRLNLWLADKGEIRVSFRQNRPKRFSKRIFKSTPGGVTSVAPKTGREEAANRDFASADHAIPPLGCTLGFNPLTGGTQSGHRLWIASGSTGGFLPRENECGRPRFTAVSVPLQDRNR